MGKVLMWAVGPMLAATLATGAVTAQPSNAPVTAPAPTASVDGGKTLFEERCSACHETELATGQRHSPQEWDDIIQRMVGNGLVASATEIATIHDYLSKTQAPLPAK